MKKERNLWPYGILGVIFLGVILIVISIRISVKNPVGYDEPFIMVLDDGKKLFDTHNDTDEAINAILEDTQKLQEHFNFYLKANNTPTKDNVLRPYSPYLRPPHRDKNEQTKEILKTQNLNSFELLVEPIDNASIDNLRVFVFMQKIGQDSNEPEIFVFNPEEHAFSGKKSEKKNSKILLGEMYKKDSNVLSSAPFEVKLKGRWIISLQIIYEKEGETLQSVLEQEFFVSDD